MALNLCLRDVRRMCVMAVWALCWHSEAAPKSRFSHRHGLGLETPGLHRPSRSLKQSAEPLNFVFSPIIYTWGTSVNYFNYFVRRDVLAQAAINAIRAGLQASMTNEDPSCTLHVPADHWELWLHILLCIWPRHRWQLQGAHMPEFTAAGMTT
jgi:hypothetical protein